MEKLAQAIKLAEVNGACRCLADMEILKVANEDEFNLVVDALSQDLGDDYTTEDILNAAEAANAILQEAHAEAAPAEEAAPVEEVPVDPEEEKVAEEKKEAAEADPKAEAVDVNALQMAYGELAMAKEAGEITQEEFEKQALDLKALLALAKGATGNAAAKAGEVTGISNLAAGLRELRNAGKAYNPTTAKALGRTMVADGAKTMAKNVVAPTAAIGAAGLGGKKLYDKYVAA